MREYTTTEDCFDLRDMGILPFAFVRHAESDRFFFADRTFDAIVATQDLKEQLRVLYVGAAAAQHYRTPFNCEQFSQMLHCMMESATDEYAHATMDHVARFLPERNIPVPFSEIADLVTNIDPKLSWEVCRAVRATRTHR